MGDDRLKERQLGHGPERSSGRRSAAGPSSAAGILELQRLVGNQATATLVQRALGTPSGATASLQPPAGSVVQRQSAPTGAGTTSSAAAAIGTRTRRPLKDLEREFRDLIAAARAKSYNVAADNLEHFLDGKGATRSVPLTWLRSFSEVTDAEKKNQRRFERQLDKQAKAVADGGTATFGDHWDARISASVFEELYYASGVSQLTSTGTFSLRRTGRSVTITGTVSQRWKDPYNWNPGMGAYIPGHGAVSDDVGLDLKDAGMGNDYLLENLYTQTVAGTYNIGRLWDDSSFTWAGP